MPFCVGHSQLGAAYQCLNSAALKHQQQLQQPATRTTITPKRRRRRSMQQREATKSKLKYFKTPFYDNFAWYPSESFGTPTHRSSRIAPPTRPLLITVLSAHCRPAGCLAGHVLPAPFAPFPHFPFSISHFSVFAAFLEFSSRGRSYEVFAVPQRENLKCTRVPFLSARCEFKANSSY